MLSKVIYCVQILKISFQGVHSQHMIMEAEYSMHHTRAIYTCKTRRSRGNSWRWSKLSRRMQLYLVPVFDSASTVS